MNNVLVKDTNEVLGFPETMGVEEIQRAILLDKTGIISEYKPSWYETHIRRPLEATGMDMFKPKFFVDVEPTPDRAFATSFAKSVTAGIVNPQATDKEAAAFPAQAFAGQLAGTVVGFGAIGELLQATKLPGFAIWAT